MTNPDEPLVRAQFCQEWLERVAKEEEPWRSRFLAALGPELVSMIADSSRVGWLPLSVHVALSEAVDRSFGASRAHDYYRRAFAASLRGPILGPLLRTGTRILGVTPAVVLRLAGRAYEASFKNAGRMYGEPLGPNRGQLVYLDLPAICTASDAWMTSPQGSAYGVLDLFGVTGIVRLDHSHRAEGQMILSFEWNPRQP